MVRSVVQLLVLQRLVLKLLQLLVVQRLVVQDLVPRHSGSRDWRALQEDQVGQRLHSEGGLFKRERFQDGDISLVHVGPDRRHSSWREERQEGHGEKAKLCPRRSRGPMARRTSVT